MIPTERMAYSIPDACDASGFGKSSIYEAIAKNELRARKMGSRTFIMADDLKAWLEAQPEAQITYTKA
ncbi:helix-turn-helix domain-containing protein [Hyphomonas sp. GM-8P]|uniref:helix-turn-helix domain-containing protein n=1 Tax=Hyphomonas sp. GM-8P TaxID=1280945 RepID=UPI000DBFA6AB|nr:helix-turn-helix domain-containing protein [Hyphomonas sp. GM-8P]RAN39781.1 hypothetical protein HY26_14710 [Hyphomonas sp. GM-8P]